MRVSYDWLKTMIDIPEDPKTLSDEYIRTGTEVEAIDTVGESFDHVVTAKVLTKTPHPDSDHMYVCSVDVGDKNLDADGNPAPLQIVCGAQNFEAGDHIVTAMIGAVLPGDVKIKKSKLRGVVSMGMNCSARELGLGGDHSGIMILPEDTPCGMPFAEYVGSSDTVLDCEITPNRPDCLSMIGMARETGAIFDRDFHVELPAIKAETGRATDDELSVEIADEGLCDRYVARIVRNVKVGPSPDWMVKRLNALGVRPHNNIVDITNYVMMLTGQPLHAFDLDTFAERDGHRRVVVRAAQQDEKFTTLDGEERTLTSDMALITDGENPVALAGVMGGLDSEVTETTTDVLLESATFSTAHTSRTSRNLSLVSEASLRYERGVDASTCDEYSAIAAALIAEVAGGTVCLEVVDEYPVRTERAHLTLRPNRLRAHVGADISDEEQFRILTDLGCDVEGKPGDEQVEVIAPTFRLDLVREIDLYEEVLRIYGMDRIPSTLPGGAHAGGRTPDQQRIELMAQTLRACGLNETMTYSLVSSDDMEKLGMPEEGRGEAVEIINPMSGEQSVLRRSIIPGLLRSVAYNQSRGVFDIQLFERGVVFGAAEGRKSPKERTLLAGVLAGSFTLPGWNQTAQPIDFFDAKGIVENLMRELCVQKLQFKALDPDEAPWLTPGRAASVIAGGRVLGWVGEIHPLACQAFDVEGTVAAFEFDVQQLLGVTEYMRPYVDVPVYPGIEVDLAIVVDEDVTAERIEQCITSAGKKGPFESVRLFDVYRDDDRVGMGKKSTAFRITYRANDRTLTSEEVEKAHERIVAKVMKATGGEVRS